MSDRHLDQRPLRVVFAGGGVATLEAIAALRSWAPGLVAPVVISAADRYVNRPVAVAAPFGFGPPASYPLDALCASLGAVFLHDAVHEVDVTGHRVRTTGGDALPYDVLVVAIGARPYPAFEHAVTFDRETSPEDFDDVLLDIREGLIPRIALVVPDEVSWTLPAYELALLTAGHVPPGRRPDTVISIITHEATPVALFGPTASAAVRELLDAAGVLFHGGVHADLLPATALRAGGRWISTDRVVALPVVWGGTIEGLPSDGRGFLPVDARGRVDGIPDVFAAGDVTMQPIKQGGLAAQQGAIVAAQIAARAGADRPTISTNLVLRGLLCTASEPWFLRAELADVAATSMATREPLWWPPTKIASRWLSSHLRQLDAADAPLVAGPGIT